MVNITTKLIEIENSDGPQVILFTDHLTGEQEAAILTAKYADPDRVFQVHARNTARGQDSARLFRAKRVVRIRLA